MLTPELQDVIQRGLQAVEGLESQGGLHWKFETDLKFEVPAERDTAFPSSDEPPKCQRAGCGKVEDAGARKFPHCGKCQSKYCSKDCQVADWRGGHKSVCPQLVAARNGEPLDRRSVAERWLQKIRLYTCPFAVSHQQQQGRGFVFAQSPNTMRELSWLQPVRSGPAGDRSILLHYLTVNEFLETVVKEDFEMACVKTVLEAAAASYDMEKQVVLCFRARCGYLAVVVAPFVPDFAACRRLGEDYSEHDALELNLDGC